MIDSPSHPRTHIDSMSFLRYVLLALIVLGSTFGDVYLAKGMKRIGAINPSRWHDLLFAPLNPFVATGIVLLLVFYLSYLASLSWADLSYIMPSTTMGYVLTALLARFMLHEHIPVTRWLGISLITLGVGIVSGGPSLTVRTKPEEASPALEVAR